VVVVGRAADAPRLRDALASTKGIAEVGQPVVAGDLVRVEGTLVDQFDSPRAEATVDRVRSAVHAICGASGLVGGSTAVNVDARRAAVYDRDHIIPLVLLVVLAVLVVLLRSLVAPLVLMATVVLSFGAALGLSAFVFNHVFHFRGADTSFPLFIFVFLVALGIDYNIFLMTRVREESARHGTRHAAVVGLAATGGVITSAGIILAGTFATLATLPVVFVTELGFAVACGVLLDTIVVRAVLVTALTLDIGPKIWWPGRLAYPYSARHSNRKD
jgi:RND superfamily putative drug exporter